MSTDLFDMALSLGLVKTREEFDQAVEDAVRRFSHSTVHGPSHDVASRISVGYEDQPVDEDTQRDADAFELVLLDRRWSARAARDSAMAMARFRRRKPVDELDDL